MTMALLPREEIDQALSGDLSSWQIAGDDGSSITRDVEASSFRSGIELVQQVAEAAESMNHHPDIDIRYTTLRFTLSTHSEGGLTAKDVELAGKIDNLASNS
jgi:4a-hydroxytetrahydrobiopterin dehydratase